MKILATVAVVALLGGALSAWALQRAQELQSRKVQVLEQQLESCGLRRYFSASSVEDLPAPVRRYLRNALPAGVRAPGHVRLMQSGELRTDLTSTRWMPFSATQLVSPSTGGFLWNAKVDVAPFVHVRVLDSFYNGRGAGQVLLQSAVDVGHDGGTPELNSGALHRFLAEAVWYPWALVPSAQLRWSAIDNQRALATLTVQATTVSLEFRFSEAGEVTGIYTPGRWGSFGGHYAQAAWEGHFFDYQRHDGVLIPARGEVGWFREGALELVWKGTIEAVSTQPGP